MFNGYETSSPKILIVDDNPVNVQHLELILEEAQAVIIRAENGEKALAAALVHDFSLALVAGQMVGMDGFKLVELLRGEAKTRNLPILLMSAAGSSDYPGFDGDETGLLDVLATPCNPKVLLSKVRIFLKLNQQKRLLENCRKILAQPNDSLELQMQERTGALKALIDELQTEIAKRERAEIELIKARKEWQEIFEAIGHMTMVLDKKHRIIAANRAVLQQTGLTYEEIIGRSCSSVFHGSEELIKVCPLASMMANGKPQMTEMEVDALGRTYIISCTPLFDEDGQLDKIIHIATDITKRKRLKKELIQAQKMEAIGSLAGGIAHDFNNILSAVLGFTDLSLNKVEKGSALEEDLQQVYAAGIRARDLVKQILTFARRTDEELKPVRIDLVTKEVVRFLRSTIPTSIEIQENITSNSLVQANPIKIHQLLMNLCTNAAYAMNDQGVLEISLEDVLLEAADLPAFKNMLPGLYQRLKVSDNGCGIPEEIIESIFQPFFTTKDIHEGTGMGLAMVHSIIKECGGDVSVTSQVGAGTVFTILLPTTEMPENVENLEERFNLPSGAERILLVDDEPAVCRLSSRMLETCGYTVTTHTDSSKALELFAAHPGQFDLVVTDMTMPKMSGDQLTAKILELNPDMPVIIATGYNKRVSDPQAIELGAKAFLAKPFEKACLIQTVRNVLDQNRFSKS